MEEMKVLNIYKLIFIKLKLMFKIKRETALAAFQNDFPEISHRYPTKFCQSYFVQGNILSKQTKFAVSSQDPRLWNRLLINKKNMAYISGFKNSVKTSLLCLEIEIYFSI